MRSGTSHAPERVVTTASDVGTPSEKRVGYRSTGHLPDRAIRIQPLRRREVDPMARSAEAGRENARLVRMPSGRCTTELTRE